MLEKDLSIGKLEHLTNDYTGFGVASQTYYLARGPMGGGGGLECSGKPVTLAYPPIFQLTAIA